MKTFFIVVWQTHLRLLSLISYLNEDPTNQGFNSYTLIYNSNQHYTHFKFNTNLKLHSLDLSLIDEILQHSIIA